MLLLATDLLKMNLHVPDGNVGRVEDLLFEDRTWRVRYLVVDSGAWLDRRRLLITPEVVTVGAEKHLTAHLTRDEVQRSPDAGTAGLTRADEQRLHEHYRWPPYWTEVATGFGLAGSVIPGPVSATPPPIQHPAAKSEPASAATMEQSHLRTAQSLRGHRLDAADGAIGEVEDLLINPESWEVRYLVVDTKPWWPGGEVLIDPDWLTGIDWDTGNARCDLTRAEVKASPPYHPGQTLPPDYLADLHRHYQRAPRRS